MDVWNTVFVVSLVMNCIGVPVFIAHKIHIGFLNRKLVENSTHSAKAVTAVTYTLSELTKSIERDSNLTRREREEIIRLVEAFEKRVTDEIRYSKPAVSNVTVNDFNGNNAQVAQGENVKQK